MEKLLQTSAFFVLSILFQSLFSANSQSFIGINYGQVADNLPPPSETAKLLKSTSIGKVRLYGADPGIIEALANSGIGIVIGTSNADIPTLANDPNFAKQWIDSNVIRYYPASNIIVITVGNEVLTSGEQGLVSQLVQAMHNLQEALNSASLGGKIKVSTVHAMSVLKQSEPPSSGSFDPAFSDTMKGLLGFLKDTGSPFMINPYPFFAYQSDPRPETLAFCLFQPNSGRFDSGTNINYMNMFDAQVDAVRSALNAMDSEDVEIVVAETGWAYKGDSNEVGPSIENAKAYNGNLIAHLRSMVGTPLMPGKSVDTYLFALYDEDLKPGAGSERAFGLFKPDLTMTYDVGLSKTSQQVRIFTVLQFWVFADSESFIGINYGQVADNLPPPSETAKLLKSTSIGKVRLYGADPAIINALANTGIGIVVGTSNGDIPALANDPNFANQWINTNVKPYYPASNIILITVGNEVMTSGDQGLVTQLVPAMHNLQEALNSASLGGLIKVSTVHAMSVLKQSEPPSSGSFDPAFADTMKGLLGFLRDTGSPFTINPYPFFAYQSDPRPETLAFCLFQPNSGRFDSGTKITYMNMFDAQVDAIRSALNAMDSKNVEIVVAETGWPYKGDQNEVGPSIENAKAYNGNLIAHLRSMVGTPLMPGKSVDTYLFALYDENQKLGPGSERAFGLFKPDRTMTYDVGLSKSSQTPTTPTTPTTPRTPTTPATPETKTKAWCVPKGGVSDAELQMNLDYACSFKGIDCGPIQPGGVCFEPNTVASHAAFAMNLLYQTAGRNPWNCDFSQTATLTSTNPSKST
ncbi:Glycoside hydrolase [Macleaya cordata]|uniref:glucan endo-1,3-beta-D-glucosidase n=1 Tax=Macleaya cordata TaxID=56857 RepID=A0A200Q225_MACCD|nr:Glycoside hydrolase [Macleaya cordata]